MATLDWVFFFVVAMSLLDGLLSGLVVEVISLLGWVAAFVFAQWLAAQAGQWLPMGLVAESLRYAAGFVVVFVLTLIAAALLGWLARKMIEAGGLKPLDRLLGAVFGLLRGGVVVLAVAVAFELTSLRNLALWSESTGARMATVALKELKPLLPQQLGQYLPA